MLNQKCDWQIIASGLTACLLCVLSGCAGGEETLGQVTGLVTYNGKPLKTGMILFEDPARGISMSAPIGEDGRYQVQMAQGEGLPLGDYKVSIRPPIVQMAFDKMSAPKVPPSEFPNVPKKFLDAASSGLTAKIVEGPNEVNVAM